MYSSNLFPATLFLTSPGTMRVCMDFSTDQRRNGQEWNIINLKMFQNGKIQMTGCQSLEQARECVQFLIDKLMLKAPVMRIKRDCVTAIRCYRYTQILFELKT